eukprot:TRINITY_DN72182_c0_g1_i1.p1 TRINITY_DN72182_c0_g1~~TRINITY_DN72182_c0_g1_i1.p1  ORF type:complete len:165 (+),score=47.27 TRINITY_DN72182_c0_g1_i1:72-566(+)
MGNQACCTGTEASTQSEIAENSRKEPTLGNANIPGADVSTPAAAAGAIEAAPQADSKPEPAPAPAQAAPAEATQLASNEYAVTLDKSNGDRMGIDVDHKDGETLLIEMINPGLVKTWNDNPSNQDKVSMGDRIVEVNGIRSDVLQLVDECKKNQVLNLKIRRAA